MNGPRIRDLRRILALAWPVFVGQLAVVGFSTVDTLLVARSSPQDLAAMSVGAAIYVTVFIGMMGVVLAIGPIVGQLFGAGNPVQAGRQLHQAAWIAIGLSALGALVLLFPQPFLALAQAPAEVEARLRGYLQALAVALPAALLMQAYRGFNTAISRPKAVMVLQVSALVVKAPLSAILVFGWPGAGLPAMGVLGCGVATAVVMWLQAAVALTVLRRDRFYAPFQLTGRGLHVPDRRAIGEQLRLGVPMGLSIMVEVTGFSFMAVFIARLGVTAAAAHQIAANLAALLFMMPLALSSATMTLVAQRVGAGDPVDARRLARRGMQLGVSLAATMALLLWALRDPVAAVYTDDAAVMAVAVPLLTWVALFHVADAVQAMAAFVLRAFRIATLPMLIYAGALWGVGLGGGWWLVFVGGPSAPATWRGPEGYWVAATAGLVVAAVGLVVLQTRTTRRAVSSAQPATAG
ncbi:MAG: MATE family efflux transporter [Burkholderiaceae bacterium]|nr:MATE family efflux transporter [Burkholderiaceae bacterium]